MVCASMSSLSAWGPAFGTGRRMKLSIPSAFCPLVVSAPWRGRTRTLETGVALPAKKFVILSAGPFMNLLAGMIIIAVLFAGASGFYVDQISGFSEGFPLEGESGLMVGDVFYKVDGWRTYLRGDAAMLLSFNDGQGVDIEVIRNGKKIVLEDLPLYRGTYDGQSGRFGLLIGEMQIPTSFLTKLRFIGYQTLDFIQQMWFSLVQLVRGTMGVKELSGPVGIMSIITEVGTASESAVSAARNIAYFAALIAINLAVMNMLPIPALDGGRIFFLLVDAAALLLFRRKVPEKWQAAVNAACFMLLMGMMALVTLHDVTKMIMREFLVTGRSIPALKSIQMWRH